MEKLICKKCKAEVTQEDLDYAEANNLFPSEIEHNEICGCVEDDEEWGTACNCEFGKKLKMGSEDETRYIANEQLRQLLLIRDKLKAFKERYNLDSIAKFAILQSMDLEDKIDLRTEEMKKDNVDLKEILKVAEHFIKKEEEK